MENPTPRVREGYNGYAMNDPLRTRIRKVGNSLAVIIPAPVLREYGMKRGDIVEYSVKEKTHLLIYKIQNQI